MLQALRDPRECRREHGAGWRLAGSGRWEEYLEPLGIMGWQRPCGSRARALSDWHARRPRSLKTRRLRKYFGTTSEFLLNLQAHFDIETVPQGIDDCIAAIEPLRKRT
jgi:hypothetical protein